jgi:hypothetical protein
MEKVMGIWQCPICGKGGWAKYPYESIVKAHKHPIRRYLSGHLSYGKWLEQYYKDLEKMKKNG